MHAHMCSHTHANTHNNHFYILKNNTVIKTRFKVRVSFEIFHLLQKNLPKEQEYSKCSVYPYSDRKRKHYSLNN